MKIIQLDEGTIRIGMTLGLMRLADDGVYELTEKGETWLREYCERKLSEAGEAT